MRTLQILFFIIAASLSLSSQGKKENEGNFRLLYWNIQNGMWDGQTDDYQRFTTWVTDQKPDICVWCEAQKLYVTGTAKYEVETEDECIARWKRLAERYGHKYVYLSAHRDNYPQVYTSNIPLVVEKLIVGNKDTVVCHGASWYKATIGKKTLNMVSLHTWPMAYAFNIPTSEREQSKKEFGGDKYRHIEMKYICQETVLTHKKAKKEYWAMMGDYNAVSRVDNMKYGHPEDSPAFLVHDYIMDETPYKDVIKEFYPDSVISTTGGGRRIDFIYTTPALLKKATHATIVRDGYPAPVRNAQKISNFWHPSDHSPIIVDFKF